MGEPALNLGDLFTYKHYKTWPDDERWELIHGTAWSMSGGARTVHQRLAGRLHLSFSEYFEGNPCEVFLPPFDILFADDALDLEDVDSVVQPDLSVLCEPRRFFDTGYRGTPALIVEILSPSTSRKDLHDKFALYEEFGVAEYWIIDPFAQTIQVFRPTPSGRYDRGELLERTGTLASQRFPGLAIGLERLFAAPLQND